MVSEETAFVEESGQEDGENYAIVSFVICAAQQKKFDIRGKSGRMK